MVFRLCQPSDLALRLQVTIADNDAAALAACDAATGVIQSECHQRFEAVANDVITLDGSGGEYLVLPECPVTAVASVVEGGTARVLGVDYLWPTGDAGEHWRGGRLRRIWQPIGSTWASPLAWSCWPAAVVVTYSHGYADGALPADLVAVAVEIAARRWRDGLRTSVVSSAAAVTAYATASPGDSGVGLAGSPPLLWPSEKDRLDPYRRVGIG